MRTIGIGLVVAFMFLAMIGNGNFPSLASVLFFWPFGVIAVVLFNAWMKTSKQNDSPARSDRDKDSGDEVINGLPPQPDYPASDPDVTAVGGTSLLMDKHNNRVAETGWETSLDFVDYSGTKAVYSDAWHTPIITAR